MAIPSDRRVRLARLRVRLAQLLVGGDLVLRVVRDQGLQPAPPLLEIAFPETLDRKPVAQEGVARVLRQALFQLQPPR